MGLLEHIVELLTNSSPKVVPSDIDIAAVAVASSITCPIKDCRKQSAMSELQLIHGIEWH